MPDTTSHRWKAWLAVGPALVVPCLGALAYFVLFKDSGLVRVLYSLTKVFTLLWPVLALTLLLRQGLPKWAPGPTALRAQLPGLATGLLIGAAVLALSQTGLSEVVRRGAPAIREQGERFGILRHYWFYAILLSSAHALLEEYYWRWFVYGQLRRLLPPAAAHGLAGIAFGAHHVVITGVYFGWAWGGVFGAGVALGGVIWSVMFERQRTLAGAWTSHMIVDLSLMAVGHRALWGTWF